MGGLAREKEIKTLIGVKYFFLKNKGECVLRDNERKLRKRRKNIEFMYAAMFPAHFQLWWLKKEEQNRN